MSIQGRPDQAMLRIRPSDTEDLLVLGLEHALYRCLNLLASQTTADGDQLIWTGRGSTDEAYGPLAMYLDEDKSVISADTIEIHQDVPQFSAVVSLSERCACIANWRFHHFRCLRRTSWMIATGRRPIPANRFAF